jgi:hypothetical protein
MSTNCGLKRYASPNIWARIKARSLEARRVAARTQLSSCFCYGLRIWLPGGASNRAKRSTLQPGNERFGSNWEEFSVSKCLPGYPRKRTSIDNVGMSQRCHDRTSQLDAAQNEMSMLIARHGRCPKAPVYPRRQAVRTHLISVRSHSLSVWSALPDSAVRQSGAKATDDIQLECPVNVRID